MTQTASQAEWLRVRSYLQDHRHALAVDAAGAYPAERRMAGTPLLAAPEWQPAAPVPLHDIELEFTPSADTRGTHTRGTPPRTPAPLLSAPAGVESPAGAELPERPDGTRYRSYSDALRDLAAPAVFENRPTYRLTEADLTKPRLAFTRGRYFDGVDTGEAAAHEYAATRLGGLDEHRQDQHRAAGPRARIADPCDLTRRPANLAITTLTLRFEAATGRASFLLHWRDPAKVGHAGGMYQVIPVGVFQPSGEAVDSFTAPVTLTLIYPPAASSGLLPPVHTIFWSKDGHTWTKLPSQDAHQVLQAFSTVRAPGYFVVASQPQPAAHCQPPLFAARSKSNNFSAK